MHILLIHQAFASIDEAGGTRHHEMARFLAKRGHKITIIASPISYLTGKSKNDHHKWLEKQEKEDNITILRTYTYPALHRSFIHRVISFLSFMVSSFLIGLQIKKVDLIWGTSPPIFQGVTALLLAKIKRVPFLFEIRDLWPAFAIAVGVLKNKLLINASLWLEKLLYKNADKIIVNSPGFIQHLKDKGADDITLIPNGVDPTMFQNSDSAIDFRKENNLLGKFIVLYAGAHGLSNDLEIILQSASQLKNYHDIEFLFVGDGKEKDRLQQKAQNLSLTNIKFLPPVPKSGMSEILANSDACIAILKPIELYKTTYPNKVFDYMAAGKPVILAIDGVIKEVVTKANAGIPVQPGNPKAISKAVIKLYENPELSKELGKSGKKYVTDNFNRAELTTQFALLIESMR